ncbi:SDR family oxidoreductase [bacterium]|nr:SDR family oxidoreductase [bacterium]
MQLTDRVVLITGGRRVGGQLALDLADRGAHLALTYFQSEAAVSQTAEACRSRGVQAATFAADLRDPQQTDEVVYRVVETFGRIDVLINLTSIYTRTPFDTLVPTDFQEQIAANLTAPYWMAVAVAKQMRQQPPIDGLQGKIIHFTDWAVDRPYRDHLPYLVAKGGLVTLTKALAVELAPTIMVNAIAPGTIEPPPGTTDEHLERIRQSAALERIGSPADVNRAVLYLLEGTDFVTGEILRIDGGRFLGPVHQTSADRA